MLGPNFCHLPRKQTDPRSFGLARASISAAALARQPVSDARVVSSDVANRRHRRLRQEDQPEGQPE